MTWSGLDSTLSEPLKGILVVKGQNTSTAKLMDMEPVFLLLVVQLRASACNRPFTNTLDICGHAWLQWAREHLSGLWYSHCLLLPRATKEDSMLGFSGHLSPRVCGLERFRCRTAI
ncbi:hypothetical protein SRHO_G00123500 [Serrasalmus rhombeus]